MKKHHSQISEDTDLLKIGAFSRLCNLSQKALRIYDQQGLLPPAWVDRRTGYRLYHASQVSKARMIKHMRVLGLSLRRIHQICAAGPEDIEVLLAEERRRLETKRLHDERILNFLQRNDPPSKLEAITLPEMEILGLTVRIPVSGLSATISETHAKLRSVAEAIISCTAGPLEVHFHGPVNHSCDGPIDICLPLKASRGSHHPPAPFFCRWLPETSAFARTLKGKAARFPEILEAYDATWAAIERRGWQQNCPAREIYPLPQGREATSRTTTIVARPFHCRSVTC